MTQPGIAQDATVVRAFNYLAQAFGGPGYAVPIGLLMAGVSATAGLNKLLPQWIVILGLLLAVAGELSWVTMLTARAGFLVPLTRFTGFIWMIGAGFLLPAGGRRRIGWRQRTRTMMSTPRARAALGIVMGANAALFFFGALQHVGIVLGPFHEPRIIPAAIVEEDAAVRPYFAVWRRSAAIRAQDGGWRWSPISSRSRACCWV